MVHISEVEKLIIRVFEGQLSIFIVCLGCLGNLMTFIVFCRKRFRKTSLSIYFCSTAISDSLVLFDLLRSFVSYNFETSVPYSSKENYCRMNDFFSFLWPCISAWTLVLISLDRMINILFPKKFKLMTRKLFQLFLQLIIYLVTFIIFLPLFLFYEINYISSGVDDLLEEIFLGRMSPRRKSMEKTEKRFEIYLNTQIYAINKSATSINCNNYLGKQAIYWVDLFLTSILPFILMLLFSIITITSISRLKSKLKLNCRCKTEQAMKYNSFAKTSISLNLLFLFLTMPNLVLNIVTHSYDCHVPYAIRAIVRDIYFLNFANLFLINYLSNSIFKNETCNLFSCKRNKVSSNYSTN